MYWFLVELEGYPKSYSIIHPNDLITPKTENLYFNKKVKFQRAHQRFSGSIILGSDERAFVEQELKRRLMEQQETGVRCANQSQSNNKWFIMQYQRTSKRNVIHAIASKNDLVWKVSNAPKCEEKMAVEVFTRDGNDLKLANIIYFTESYDDVCQKLQQLKVRCFELISQTTERNYDDAHDSEWLLLQYNSGLHNAIYGIVNKTSTVMQNENLYDDIVAYINDGSTVFQAMILNKSNNFHELDECINRIRNFCLNNLIWEDHLDGKKTQIDQLPMQMNSSDCTEIHMEE